MVRNIVASVFYTLISNVKRKAIISISIRRPRRWQAYSYSRLIPVQHLPGGYDIQTAGIAEEPYGVPGGIYGQGATLCLYDDITLLARCVLIGVVVAFYSLHRFGLSPGQHCHIGGGGAVKHLAAGAALPGAVRVECPPVGVDAAVMGCVQVHAQGKGSQHKKWQYYK